MKYELGEVICTRELYLEGEQNSRKIVVRVGKPVPFADSSDYFAPFQIEGIGSENVLCAGGVDGVQALQDVMKVIGAQLQALNQQCGNRLRWDAGSGGDLGFPLDF